MALVLVVLVLAAVTTPVAGAVPGLWSDDADPGTAWVEVPDPLEGERPTSTGTSIGAPTLRDVPYVDGAYLGCPGPDVDEACSGSQTLDVYESTAPGRRPVVVWIHSGGWAGGDKLQLDVTVPPLQAWGFDVVSVNYRLSRGSQPVQFPAAVLDVKAAIRWVKANADRYLFDPTAIVAMGTSAGGHLAQMVATTAGVTALEPTVGLTGAQAAVSSRVTAAVSVSGMGDIAAFLDGGHPWAEPLTESFLGCASDCPPERLREASATTYATADDAPVYAITGDQDTLALPVATDLLGAAYARAGIGPQVRDDAVDSGPLECRGHVPWCGVNGVAHHAFVHWVAAIAAQHRADPFIAAVHQDFLARPPTAAELDRWRPVVDSAAGREALVVALAHSDAYIGAMVDRFYLDTLGRRADSAGRAYWVETIRSGQATPATVAGLFYGSEEYFQAVGGDLGAWVDDLYLELLGRPAEQAGRDYWMAVATWYGRPAVSVPFYQALEPRLVRVARLYRELLGRDPDPAGQRWWAEVLLRSGDDIDLAVALATSPEYYVRTQR